MTLQQQHALKTIERFLDLQLVVSDYGNDGCLYLGAGVGIVDRLRDEWKEVYNGYTAGQKKAFETCYRKGLVASIDSSHIYFDCRKLSSRYSSAKFVYVGINTDGKEKSNDVLGIFVCIDKTIYSEPCVDDMFRFDLKIFEAKLTQMSSGLFYVWPVVKKAVNMFQDIGNDFVEKVQYKGR